MNIPDDHKRLALAMLSMEQLHKVLLDPRVTEQNKKEVRKEIRRRETK